MGRYRISIIIPTFNRGRFVVEAVRSALAQTHGADEIIVVDDGSTDDTRERLAAFGDRIIFIEQENQGVAAARNNGIRRATGEFVAFLDSDDLWHREKLEIQAQYLEQHPEVDLLAGRVGELHSRDQCTAPLPGVTEGLCAPVAFSRLVVTACIQTSSVIVRRSCVEMAGLFDPSLRRAEDRDLWIRIASRYHVRRLEMMLTFSQTEQREQLSRQPGQNRTCARRMLDKVFREVPELRGRWMLKRRALSVLPYETAIQYAQHGKHGAVIRLVLRSLALWPLPYRRDEAKGSLARSRTLAVAFLRIVGLKAPARQVPITDPVAME